MRLLFRAEVRGTLQRHDRMLIVSNHVSFLDGITLGAFLPIQPTYLVHSTVARLWYFKIGLKFIPHLVVDSASPLAIKAIINLVESGSPVVIFPEGRITLTGSMMKVYEGPAFVAAKSGAMVVPIHIDGLLYSYFSRMTGDFPKKFFPKVTITVGQPRTIPMPEGRTPRIRRRAASESMRKVMQRSAFEARKPGTVFERMLDAMALHGKSRMVLEDINQKPASYKDVLKGSLALGRLACKFTSEGEFVGVLMPNVNAAVYLLFGMTAMRRVPAMLNYTAGTEGMQSACRSTKIKVIFTSRAFLEKAKLVNVVNGLRDVKILYLEDLRAQFGIADKLWLIGWARWFPRTVIKPVKPHDPLVVLYTSGSEGKPKGVVLSHDSVLSNCDQVYAILDFTRKDKFLSALPLFHAFGLMAGIILPLQRGTPVFLYPSPLHYRVIPEIIYDRDCTVLFATNTFLANYCKFAHPYDFARLRYMVVGAEKLTEEVRRTAMDKFGIRALEGYGATECSPVIAVNTPLANKPGSVGEIVPGMDYQLEPVPGIEEGGALHVHGPSVMLGYLKEDQPGVIQPPTSSLGAGWYNTGDIVAVDEGGFISIQGRLRRFAKIAGEMVSLETVEKIAELAAPNSVHASSSIKDAHRGEMIVVFTQDASLSREQLTAAARQLGAPEIAIPRRIIHLDKIPLLGNGKKDYVSLLKMAEEMTQTTAGRV
jgi:acyl-[acyl-carrier-protein]-phospholipid O-acyltransferase / long-chain-fatty-acid--[acyl-carrier-protein] ligase